MLNRITFEHVPSTSCSPSPSPHRVDEHTQSAAGCTSDRVVSIRCYARDGVTCTRSGTAQTYRSLTEEGEEGGDAAVVLPGLSDEVERCAGDLYNVSDAIFNTTSPCAFIDPDKWVETPIPTRNTPLSTLHTNALKVDLKVDAVDVGDTEQSPPMT